MKKALGTFAILGLAFALSACGNGDGHLGGGSGPGPSPTPNTVELGTGSGDSFQAGKLGIASPQLRNGGSTGLFASLQYSDGTPYTAAATISFTSACYQKGGAVFTVNGKPANQVNTDSKGHVQITYTARDCSGDDAITATVVIDGNVLHAAGTVTVASPTSDQVELGSGSGSNFQQGVLGIVKASVPASGSTAVLAALQYSDHTAYTDLATVTFTSACYEKGNAIFTVNGKTTNKVTTTTGQVKITYRAKGCSGPDAITASSIIDHNLLKASGTVTVGSPAANQVQLGTGSGKSFQQGVLGIVNASIPATGSTAVLSSMQYSDGTPYKKSATIAFTSACYEKGGAVFIVDGKSTNKAKTSDGQVQVTYQANGCNGPDTVTASAIINHTVLKATGTVTVASSGTNEVVLGTGTGSSFQPGVLGITYPNLPASGSTPVLATLQYADGTPYKKSAMLTFTSPCYNQGRAIFKVNGQATNKVDVNNEGQARISYEAAGCSDTDTITATTTIDGNVLHASSTVTVASTEVELGTGSGDTFQPGVLGIVSSQLPSGGSTNVLVTLQRSDGGIYTKPTEIGFISACYQSGKAKFSSKGKVTTDATGHATITYTSDGCSGDDKVTATATVDNTVLRATGTVTTVKPSTVLLGTGSGDAFQPNVLGIVSPELPQGGSTDVLATLQHADGTPYTDAATITFSSACFENGQAAFKVDGVATNKVNTTSGHVTISYANLGCTETDAITATSAVDNNVLHASGSVSVVASSAVLLGSGSGATFQSGTLGIVTQTLSDGGETDIHVTLQHADGSVYKTPTEIGFTSACAQSGKAAFSDGGKVTTDAAGHATITYTSDGCSGADKITAAATVDANVLHASGTVTTLAPSTVLLGTGSGEAFQSGKLGIVTDLIAAGGSTEVRVTLQHADGSAYTTPSQIAFSSACYVNGQATFSDGGKVTTDATGHATITYTSTDCGGTDTITATATVNENVLHASGTVTTATPATVLLGTGSGDAFQTGVLGIVSPQLVDGGATDIYAALQHADGSVYSSQTEIAFTSACYRAGRAIFTVNGATTNKVTTDNTGHATITYASEGCNGDDDITATAVVDNNVLHAHGTVTVTSSIAAVELGSGSGSTFQQGILGVVTPELNAGGSTHVLAALQYADGGQYTDPTTIAFSSRCYREGGAFFSVNGQRTNKVTTTSGQADIKYTAQGCNGSNTITATAVIGHNVLQASGVVTVGATADVELGSGTGDSFKAGVLGIVMPSLPATGSTAVLASLSHSDGTPYTGSATVTFTSPCYQTGGAAFLVNGQPGNSVTTTDGEAEISYKAQGCGGADTITATTAVNGNVLQATGTVTVASLQVSLGNGSGASFQPDVLGIESSNLSAGGSTNVYAALQYSNHSPYRTKATITFTSACYRDGKASFSVNGTPQNSVTTSTGQAQVKYSAKGCQGDDDITATVVVNHTVLHASGTVSVEAPAVKLGSGGSDGAPFQEGVLAIGSPSLSAGGSTNVVATLEYADGSPYIGPATLTFNSPCYQSGTAAFKLAGQPTNKVSTNIGQVNITYVAQGCVGKDTITATTTIGGSLLTATGNVTVAAAQVGYIKFISADPTIIALKGSGGNQSSTIVFKVTDASGGPVRGAHVNFTPDTRVGGITLTPTSATTGTDGEVQTVLKAGTQHTTVRVTASTTAADGERISTQSPGIVIGTGLASQKHFSLQVASHNAEGWTHDGATVKVGVRLSDRYGNPVPASTAVAFVADGGQIPPGCTTEGETGACSVLWTSADPRPQGSTSDPLSDRGHAEILAYATGEESFEDINGNGIFDKGDKFTVFDSRKVPTGSRDNFFGLAPSSSTVTPPAPSTVPQPSPPYLRQPPQDDIGEIYLDQNQNGEYDNGEFYFDFNGNDRRDAPDGMFHGVCSTNGPDANALCDPGKWGVGLQTCIVMSTSKVSIYGPTTVTAGNFYTYKVLDENGNVPPAGMQFDTVLNGPSAEVVTAEVQDISDACRVPRYSGYAITIKVDPNSSSGHLKIRATSPQPPGGTGTVSLSGTITVQ
jgi:hypothetical protein